MTNVDRAAWERIYVALAGDIRRELVRYLKQVQVARIEDVAHELLGEGTDSTKDEFHAIRLRLHHLHLPKLADAGLLGWDRHEDQITLTALGSQLPAELITPSLLPSPDEGHEKRAID